MIKYAKIINTETGLCEVGLGTNEEFYVSIGMVKLNVDLSDVDNNWYLFDKCPHKSEEEKREEERKRIANLTCTKRVLILMLEELGYDYFEQIQPLIELNRKAKLEWELCSELLRSNPLLNIIGEQLLLSPEQIDRLFKYANGEVDTIKEVNND